jgi:hypothetical protein
MLRPGIAALPSLADSRYIYMIVRILVYVIHMPARVSDRALAER